MELQEKTMVADTLAGINGELIRYAEMIAQSENKELKQTLKQFRNACEQSQEELYQIASFTIWQGRSLTMCLQARLRRKRFSM